VRAVLALVLVGCGPAAHPAPPPPGPCAGSPTARFTTGDDGETATVTVGQVFTVEIGAARSYFGYRDPELLGNIVELIRAETVPPQPGPGEEYVEIYTYCATSTGTAELTAEYVGDVDQDPFRLFIRVR
jgi:hypothetical protein